MLRALLTTAARSNKKPAAPRRRLRMESLEKRELLSVNIQFDYSLDTKGFFNTQERRDLLQYAASMLTARMTDTLDAIKPSGSNTWKAKFTHPGTGNSTSITNKSIPANTLVVYAGGRNLSGSTLAEGGPGGYWSHGSAAWNKTVGTRGETGAGTATKTDTAPWGGVITFDTTGVKWHFGKTTNGLASNEHDFVSVAMHELGHVLGFTTSTDGKTSWTQLISGGRFRGADATAENNGVSPKAAGGHFVDGVSSDGIEAMMDPSINSGARKWMSQLDAAALDDIGWSLSTSNDTIFQAQHQLTHRRSSGGLSVSDSTIFNGSIGSAKDVDLYRIWADAATQLNVDVSKGAAGTTRVNTYLRLFDAAGSQLKAANQGGTGGTDKLSYKITRSDYYYVGVSSYGNRSYVASRADSGPGGATGSYSFAMTMADAASGVLFASTSNTATVTASTTAVAPVYFTLPPTGGSSAARTAAVDQAIAGSAVPSRAAAVATPLYYPAESSPSVRRAGSPVVGRERAVIERDRHASAQFSLADAIDRSFDVAG